MHFAEGRGDGDGQRQEPIHRHGCAEQPFERLAAGVLQDQHGPPAVALERKRPGSPFRLQLRFQAEFVREPIEDTGRGLLGRCDRGEHAASLAGAAGPPSAVEDALPVIPQNFEAVVADLQRQQCIDLDSHPVPGRRPATASRRELTLRCAHASSTSTQPVVACPAGVQDQVNATRLQASANSGSRSVVACSPGRDDAIPPCAG
jgi:hypothetical protein